MTTETTFHPGCAPSHTGPLARYLPPMPSGAAADWLRARGINPGSDTNFILDPFGAAPRLAVELAQAGYALLVAANNPITRFLIEMMANPPQENELRAAIAELASARRGDERLEPHLRALYETTCDQCRSTVEAQAFLWDRERSAPYARLYCCPTCGQEGEFPATERDLIQAARFAEDRLHRSRALERVVSQQDPERENVEEALSLYVPRAVYVLFTMINKLDGLSLSPDRRRQLVALLLSVCDQANALWPHPSGRPRPRQLVAPPRFRENNLWLALEASQQEWLAPGSPVPVVHWPEAPKAGSICIFEGRLKEKQAELAAHQPAAVAAALPRPNQAFWTLSALWSGWLWGREALGPFRSVLRRKRYDWNWHAGALAAGFTSLASVLQAGTPIFGIIGEAESGFISAALLGAEAAGLELADPALRAESGQVQITWLKSSRAAAAPLAEEPALPTPGSALVTRLAEWAGKAALAYLQRRGEPASYLQLHTAALSELVQQQELFQPAGGQAAAIFPGQMLSAANQALEQAFTYRGGLRRYGGSEKSLEVGAWWLRDEMEASQPLSDRIEMELVRYLVREGSVQYPVVDTYLCSLFTGLLTPGEELLTYCLHSYAAPDAEQHVWQLRSEDQPQARRSDIAAIRQHLTQLGKRLGFLVSGDRPLLWSLPESQPTYRFYMLASAIFAELVAQAAHPAEQAFLVIPGGRADLALYKLKTNPYLAQIIQKGWGFLKFRHVQQLSSQAGLTLDQLEEQLALDPLQESSSQMRLF